MHCHYMQWWQQIVCFAIRLGIGALRKDILNDDVWDAQDSMAIGHVSLCFVSGLLA